MSWLSAFRIAWREIAASRSKFVFIMLAVAVGVGSLTGVRSFGRAFRTMLTSEARTLMAGDVSVRVFDDFGQGGFVGPRSELFLSLPNAEGERVPLSGSWRFHVEHALPLVPNEVFQSYPSPPELLARVS